MESKPVVISHQKAQPETTPKATTTRDYYGDHTPWAEPAWYNTLSSPYYNDSHRRLRNAIREYVDEHIIPYEEEWEEQGEVPQEVSKASYARYSCIATCLRSDPGSRQVPQSRPRPPGLSAAVSRGWWHAVYGRCSARGYALSVARPEKGRDFDLQTPQTTTLSTSSSSKTSSAASMPVP